MRHARSDADAQAITPAGFGRSPVRLRVTGASSRLGERRFGAPLILDVGSLGSKYVAGARVC